MRMCTRARCVCVCVHTRATEKLDGGASQLKCFMCFVFKLFCSAQLYTTSAQRWCADEY